MRAETLTWVMLVGGGLYTACDSSQPIQSPMTTPAGSQTIAGSVATPASSGGKPAAATSGTAGVSSTPSTAGASVVSGTAGVGPIAMAGAKAAPTQGDVAPVATGGTTAAGSGGASAGSSAAAGAGPTAGVGPIAGSGMPAEMDYGKGDGKDVITIGDSWMNIATNGGGIEAGLDRAGTKYRHYAQPGTTLIMGQIPVEYDQAKAMNPKIATIVMTGGGNDVMFSGGCNTKAACTMSAQNIADALDQLWTKAAADGVTSTVYIQYSRNAGTAPADTRPDMAPVPKICTSGKIRCITIETTDIIAASDLLDGIHPNQAGCDRIAKRTLEEMAKNGIRR